MRKRRDIKKRAKKHGSGRSRHHRKAKALGGKNDERNISVVNSGKHKAFHLLFKEGNPFYIKRMLNEIWLDPEYVCEIRRKSTD
jgi:hypothetical protein